MHCQVVILCRCCRFWAWPLVRAPVLLKTHRVKAMIHVKSVVAQCPHWHEMVVRRGATRGLLVKDHVILNHGHVTWMTPELASPSPNYHTTPTGGRFSSRQI
ncbi:hypothetical protein TNCV_1138651 [Trichonephila clavipes]|nr:hypothetical protein TNCV_1138651 [Trichonephila clavipes]